MKKIMKKENGLLNEIKAVREIIARDATESELILFAKYCERSGLDPFSNQIHFIKRAGKPTFQTAIDGFRVIAQRSGDYEGQTKVQWCGEDGKWVDVWLQNTPPIAASVGVFRKDFKEPIVAVAKYKSYAVETNILWKKMPEQMLAKVAEALALRKAFPNDLAGMYIHEEMDQAGKSMSESNNKMDIQKVISRISEIDNKERIADASKWLKKSRDRFNAKEYAEMQFTLEAKKNDLENLKS